MSMVNDWGFYKGEKVELQQEVEKSYLGWDRLIEQNIVFRCMF